MLVIKYSGLPSGARSCQAGFTAIELMVVVSILAVLAALAMPSFRDTLERYRVRRAVEDLTATIYMARSEAIKRNGLVVLRKATPTPAGCSVDTAQEWSCGWMVFVDTNNNGTRDASEEILQTSKVPTGVNVMNAKDSASFKVDRWGKLNGAGMVGFTVQSTAMPDLDHVTTLCMSAGGRLRALPGEPECPT